jgi:ATP-dependent RNA helicase SUPV3L1/SUV3
LPGNRSTAEVAPPEGAIETGGGFTVTVAMTSLLGCAGEDFSAVLKSLGYRLETKEVQRPAAPKADATEADARHSRTRCSC